MVKKKLCFEYSNNSKLALISALISKRAVALRIKYTKYSSESKPLYKVLFYFNKKTANKGKVIGIPYSIVEYEGKTIQLKQKEYLLLNQNNESKIVNIKNIYGIEKS